MPDFDLRPLLLSGDFARLCKVSKDTLLYYDKIGVLKPAARHSNGYRSYEPEQFVTIEFIRLMSQFGWSLSAIKAFLKERSIKRYVETLEELKLKQQVEADALQRRAVLLDAMLHYARLLNRYSPEKPRLMENGELRRFILSPYKHLDSSREMKAASSITDHIQFCEKATGSLQFPLGRIVTTEHLHSGRYMRTEYLCSPMSPDPDRYASLSQERTLAQEPGLFVQMLHKGDPYTALDAYTSLMDFIAENKLTPRGPAVELWLVSLFTASKLADYVSLIEIPVCTLDGL